MEAMDEMTERLSAMLGEEMGAAAPDLKRLRELSGLMKELSALRRELKGEQPRTLTVRFEGEADACSR